MTNTPPQPPDAVLDPEPWDYLARHRERKQRCLDDAAKIQNACPKDPGHAKTPAADCKVCHRKIIDRISRRYLDRPETEWYADRRPFLQHLAELFPAVKRGEVDASGIEDRVMDEKRRWHREAVRRLALAMGQLGMPQRRDELSRLLDDRKLEFGDFCARVRDVVSTAPCPPGALERLISTRNDPEARVEAYKEVFFSPYRDEQPVGESARRYLEMVERGVSMSKVAARIVEDRRQGIADRAELERLQNRIEYLKKAKATWLAQRKRGQAEQHEEKPAKAPPPCLQCGLRPDVADPPSCAVCQVAVAHGIMDEPVVYCSEECQRLGHGQHVEKAHKCAAGEHCVTLYHPEEDKESGGSTDPTGYEGDAYLCKECLEQRKSVAVFCTLACAEANFTRHREGVHHRTSWSGGAKANLVTLEQALQDLKEKRVIDELKSVPKLRPVADPPKTQPAEDSDARMAIERGDNAPRVAEPNAATTPADEMDTDGADKREIDAAPAGPPQTSSIRHSDEVPGVDKMEGVETEPATQQPADDRNADTEMMDAVDVADFAMRREPAEAEPASAAGKPAAEDSTAQTPAAKTSTTEKSAGEESTAEQSTAEIPAGKEEPTKEKPAEKESAAEEPAAKEPAAKEPAVEETAAGQPAEKEEPSTDTPAAKEPAAENPTEEPAPEATANPGSKAPKDAAASPTPDSNPHSGLHSDPTSDPYPFKNVPTNPEDAAESLPLAEPKTAEEANRPSRTIAAPDNKVTSIEPMPSLGRSLEVEIGKIPAGQEAEPSDAGAGAEVEDAGAEEVLAQIRNIDVKAMDKIADEKAVGLNHGSLLGARRDEAKKPKDPREDGFTQAVEDVAAARRAIDKETDAENDRRAAKEEEGEHAGESGDGEAGEKQTGSDAAPAADRKPGSEKPDVGEKADSDKPDSGKKTEDQQQSTVGQQPKDDNTPTTSDEPASGPVARDVAAVPGIDVSQPSAASSMEEGEIADDAGKKRKAPSAEPGEADGGDGQRETKKARSEEAADTGADAKTDTKAVSEDQTRRD